MKRIFIHKITCDTNDACIPDGEDLVKFSENYSLTVFVLYRREHPAVTFSVLAKYVIHHLYIGSVSSVHFRYVLPWH